ncbi:hypothetical protein FE810_15485 [Thalassotalea litorea]|uniref:DUF465 domain-containing protein n=1 Tax=Thalassotalea litorea TaxID=2020715 RepID=A0A5R9IIT8_9GAMM|nr:hypothetical protein FE810_15485 [Thalassotalea litorea]
MTVAESKIMLLGLPEIATQLKEYGEFLAEFRRRFYDGKSSLTERDMDNVRIELLNKRKAIFDDLAQSYRKGV